MKVEPSGTSLAIRADCATPSGPERTTPDTAGDEPLSTRRTRWNSSLTASRHKAETASLLTPGMSMETYRMEISENPAADELLVDVYDIDGLIEVSERIPYEDYALTSTTDESPEPRVAKATADVMALDVQVTRAGEAFAVRLLGDREELAAERVSDADWGLTNTGE